MNTFLFTALLPMLLLLPSEPVPDLKAVSSWWAGSWQNEAGTVEEHWMTAGGGVMIGMNRDLRKPERPFFEYLRLEQRQDGLYYVAQPLGKTPTAFKCIRFDPSENEVVFQNAEHDYPQVITYRRRGDQLCAWIGTVAEPKKSVWCWRRKAAVN